MFNTVRAAITTTIGRTLNGLGSQATDVGPLSFFTQWFNPNNMVGELEQLEKYTGVTYACISAIAEDVAKIKFTINKKKADGTLVPVQSHPFLDVLQKPNPTQSDFEFMEMTQTHIELTGEAFWYVPKGAKTGAPKELWLMRPDLVQVVFDQETGEVTGYIYHKYNGRVSIPLDLDEVIHFKMPNPINPYRGMGTVQAGIVYIQTEEFASQFSRNFLANNATPAGIVNFKGTIPDGEFQKVKRQWTREYGSVANAGKTAFVRSADVSYQKIGSSLSDIDLKELKNLTRDDIMFMFRVSKPILGITEDVNYSNAQTAEYIFAKRVIDPKMNRIVDTIQTFYNKKYKDNFIVSYTSPIPQNNEEKIAYYEAGINKWLTPDEVRALEGMDAIEGGDKIRMPLNLVAIDGSGRPPAAPKVDPTSDQAPEEDIPADPESGGGGSKEPGSSATDGEGEDDSSGANAPAKAIAKKRYVLKAKKDASTEVTTAGSGLEQSKEDFRLLMVSTRDAYVPQLEHAVNEAISKQRSKVLGQIKAWKKKDVNSDELDYNTDETAQDIQDSFEPITFELMAEAGKYAMQLVDPTLAYELQQSSMERIKERIAKVAGDYSAQTQQALVDVISQGIKDGENITTIRKNIEAVFSDATGYRAERLARTEAAHEANYATLDAYMQTGYVMYKEWYAGGVDPCQFCEALNGQTVSTEDVFLPQGASLDGVDGGVYLANYQDIEAGDLHPNCMCTILPVIAKE